jgi:predicted GNAT family N-acyltransferase
MSVDFGEFPEEVTRRLPHYRLVPATLIGRLAVDVKYRKQSLGEFLLLDALNRTYRQADRIAAAAVIVDAKDNEARTFYKHYGFISFPERQDRLLSHFGRVKTPTFRWQLQRSSCTPVA